MSAARSTVLVLLGLMALAAVLLRPPPAVLAQSPSTDATLGGLTLSEGRLDPVFATGATDYAAGVGYTVSRITVVPTTTDANATVAYLDGSDTPLPDANTVTDEQDVDLVVGETVVKLKITAADTSTLLTYTVTITRTEEDTSLRPTASDPVAANPSTAVYGVTFQGTWTSSVTPDGVPGGAHFSRLIGGVHSAAVTFLEGGQTASTGVESMAEVGGVSDLKSEVQTAIDASPQTALSVLEGDTDSIGPATAKTLGNVELTSDFPRVTLTTMVAPSPDWFVGVSGLPLLDDQGRWLRTHELNLYPWDAGTEDGTEFSLSNAATNPRGVITSIRGTGKFSTERIASLSFTLESVRTTRSVAENTAAGADIGAPLTAATVGAVVTYTLGGTDAASFDIVEATGQLQAKAALDYETKSSYEVMVTATNSEGSVDIIVTIDVTNIIELQPLTGPATVGYEENQAVRVATFSASSEEDRELLSWSLSGPDAGSFRIDEPAGVLRFDLAVVSPNLFSPLPDYEAPTDTGSDGAYEVTVEVGDGVTTHSLDVEVTITDQDEAGTLTLSTSRPRQAELVTATLSDPDTVTGTPVWTWERSAGRNKWAVIDGATSASYTPAAADTNTFLRITATYDDEHGSNKIVREVPPYLVTGPLLTGLTGVTTDSQSATHREFAPGFDAQTLHYQIGCADTDSLTLTASAMAGHRITVDGVQVASGASTTVPVTAHSDVSITVSGSDGAQTTYAVRCIATDFPQITATKRAAASDVIHDLMLLPPDEYLVILDHNGVPRFRRKLSSSTGIYFRFQRVGENGDYRYSHHGPGQAQVVRDENLDEIRTVTTVAPLTVIGRHDQRVLEDGNSLLMAYQPNTRDLSSLPFPDENGDPWGTSVEVQDSVFQIVTPDGQAEFTWNSWDSMLMEDCTQHRFPNDYAHINSLQLVDGLIIASLRGCSKVLAVDPELEASHKIAWRLGRSNLSDEQWESRDLGPASLDIVNDPEGNFCGQHAAQLLPNGHLVLYDNGVQCLENPGTGDTVGREGYVYSRAVEYAIDLENGEAVFVRDHSLHGEERRLGYAGGHVEPLDNGDWLISWGRTTLPTDPWGFEPPYPLDEAVTQVDPATGVEKFSLIMNDDTLQQQRRERATVMPPEALAPQPDILRATLPPSTHTSVFHLGATDSPQVVVAFSRPVVDFDETSPSLSVSGATVASVSAHVVAGEPANAYLVSLTPDGDGAITFGLLADQACAGGGICAADGTTLSEVPAAPVTIDVTNIIELQPITGPATVGYEENRAVRVATFSASSEADRELLTWSLSGPDAGSFRIDEPAGVLRFDLPAVAPNLFAPQPDYEAPTDTGTDGAYEVTVEVGDGVTTHSLDVEVTITDQDEAGTLTLSPTRPRQAELVTATLSDPDTVTGTPVWTWERSAGRSAWHRDQRRDRCQLHTDRRGRRALPASDGVLYRRSRLRPDRPDGGAQRRAGANTEPARGRHDLLATDVSRIRARDSPLCRGLRRSGHAAPDAIDDGRRHPAGGRRRPVRQSERGRRVDGQGRRG